MKLPLKQIVCLQHFPVKSHAGLAGVCGNLPDCDNCKLSLECHWYATEGNSEKMAIGEKIQRNKISTADILELMQWLLSSNPEEAKALQNSLNAEHRSKIGAANVCGNWKISSLSIQI